MLVGALRVGLDFSMKSAPPEHTDPSDEACFLLLIEIKSARLTWG